MGVHIRLEVHYLAVVFDLAVRSFLHPSEAFRLSHSRSILAEEDNFDSAGGSHSLVLLHSCLDMPRHILARSHYCNHRTHIHLARIDRIAAGDSSEEAVGCRLVEDLEDLVVGLLSHCMVFAVVGIGSDRMPWCSWTLDSMQWFARGCILPGG